MGLQFPSALPLSSNTRKPVFSVQSPPLTSSKFLPRHLEVATQPEPLQGQGEGCLPKEMPRWAQAVQATPSESHPPPPPQSEARQAG